MRRRPSIVIFGIFFYLVSGKLTSKENRDNSANDLEDVDSSERIGPVVTQVAQHPYSASLLQNNTYLCSAVILNTYWLLTSSKCFDTGIISSYVTHKNLNNFTVRVGSSYNDKDGFIYKIKMLINNYDMQVSAVKLQDPLTFGSRVSAVRLPQVEDEVTLGYLASIMAWTPSGKDNGGAIIQNNTLVGIANFRHSCAVYTKIHAFPKVASFTTWLDSVIWDEESRPNTSTSTSVAATNVTEKTEGQTLFADPRKYLLTLPFDPINVPLEPAEDNSVIPRMSLYESYLQSLANAKTSTTQSPEQLELAKRAWLKKFGKAAQMMPPTMFLGKYNYDYNQ